MINVVIVSKLAVGAAPWNIYHCLSKYAADSLSVRFITFRNSYDDGRVFPFDLLWSDPQAIPILKNANAIHFQNHLPEQCIPYINKNTQKIYGTLHSVPRMGNWQELLSYCHQTFVIRQPAQMREYPNLKTLPTPFDIWEHMPDTTRKWNNPLTVLYCPSNKFPVSHRASKGYSYVLPLLQDLEKKGLYNLLHFMGIPYIKNLELKKQAHIVIDDIVADHKTFHLTSIEAAAHAQAVLTGTSSPYPFLETTQYTLELMLKYLFDRPDIAEEEGAESRNWIEKYWNPQDIAQEYIHLYNS